MVGTQASHEQEQVREQLSASVVFSVAQLAFQHTHTSTHAYSQVEPNSSQVCWRAALLWPDFSFGFQSEICFERRRNIATGRKRCEALQTTLK